MGYRIAPVWEVLYKWIYFVHKWFITLLFSDIATDDIASVWKPTNISVNRHLFNIFSDWLRIPKFVPAISVS